MSDRGTFTPQQIGVLADIESWRLSRGQPGLRAEFQEFITRLMQEERQITRGVTSCVQRLHSIGFLGELGYDKPSEYHPDVGFPPAPPERGVFDQMVLVEPRIDIQRIADYLGMRFIRSPEEPFTDFRDVVDRPIDRPYWVWAQVGKLYIGQSHEDASRNFLEHEEGMTLREGLFFLAHFPHWIRSGRVLLPGSRHKRAQAIAPAIRADRQFTAKMGFDKLRISRRQPDLALATAWYEGS